jgi:DNA polymerase-3 subunit epsilon
MAELTQSVVVCNLEGTVLLFNEAARALLGRGDAGAAAPLGLGRSIFGRIDRALVAHALERIEAQRAAGEPAAAQCLASLAGAGLIRLRIAPVLGDDPSAPPEGVVMLLDDLTRDLDEGASQDRLLRRLADATRGGLASIRAAAETLADFGEMPPERRARFVHAIRDEAVTLSGTLDAAWSEHARSHASPWPLEEMRGADLLRLAAARIRAASAIAVDDATLDEALWLRCDSFALVQALGGLAARLAGELEVAAIELRLSAHERHAAIDLAWRGAPISSETAATWEIDAPGAGETTLREVVDRHRGEVWFQRERASHRSYFRLLLPLAAAPARGAAAPAPRVASRPEYYDFDLFAAASLPRELADRPLAALACTVFDTETTGLDPRSDRIVSIAAVRVLNGRVLADDAFEQLVDPGVPVPPASTAIHGIDDAMLAGQPPIDAVLPRFARFAEDTVLVAHNAAFDLRFLQALEGATGVRFAQPVLDTLLLSALAQPGETRHDLESIARRLGVEVLGRHTALGDAAVTAAVFARLVPMLGERGIVTLGQAQAASRDTWYARLKY